MAKYDRRGSYKIEVSGAAQALFAEDDNITEWVIRCAPTIETVNQLNAAAFSWQANMAYSASYKGSVFQSQAINLFQPSFIPPYGGCFGVKGNEIKVAFSGTSGIILTADIVPGRITDSIETVFNASLTHIPLFAVAFRYSVEGGAQPGDLIEFRDYSGALLTTYPADDSNAWKPLAYQAGRIDYVPVAGGGVCSWQFLIKS